MVTRKTRPIPYTIWLQPTLVEEIRVARSTDPQLDRIKTKVLVGKTPRFVIHEDGMLRFQNRVRVPPIEELKRKILDEGHNTPHFIHPDRNKRYKDLKRIFWWSNVQQEVVDYLAKSFTCQRVKAEHQRPA